VTTILAVGRNGHDCAGQYVVHACRSQGRPPHQVGMHVDHREGPLIRLAPRHAEVVLTEFHALVRF
jgi:hypothetical protein